MTPASPETRTRIVATAREWLGTPYKHQASLKGVAADCLGVVRGVFKELHGRELLKVPPYQPDWYDLRKDDVLFRGAQRYLIQLDTIQEAEPGDVLVFRMHRNMAAKHCGFVAPKGRMIHALTGRTTIEVTLGTPYLRRAVGAFRFPEVE